MKPPLPSRRMLAALAVAAAAAALSPPAALAGAALLVALWAADWRLARRTEGLALGARAPARAGQGQELALALELENRTGRDLALSVAVDVARAVAGEGVYEPRALELPHRGRAELAFPLAAARRGRHALERAHLRVLGPLALAWHREVRPLGRELLVVPGLREVRGRRLAAWRSLKRSHGRRAARERGDSGAFESLREYVRGDDPRRIDWKATARRAQPAARRSRAIVRRYEAERSQSVALVVDAGRLMAESFEGRERLDHALAASVVLADVARLWDDKVGFFAFADGIEVELPPGNHPPDRIPALAAEVVSRAVEPDYPRALVTLSRRLSRRSLIVVFSDVIDEAVSEPLATHLALLARRHLPVLVALKNPELERAVRAPAADPEAAWLRAAATELALARERTLAAMRKAGIQVLDVLPGAAVEAAVDRYVQIKRSGAL